ncbi:hypothetical protein CcCBS67573_g07994 [Chytriomyces confervae]|uniref:Leucine carboxyl methyltransferase 1 n=1 Tax=Chytriomyces confervae TaxID=246404 RepID=A0A507ERE2_9FUNG|nr:hypothetical protein CcCBS67573_g07994 [Chytriomyces confervae]
MASDKVTVQGTNVDATVARLSAINLGYFKDPFTTAFVKMRSAQRKPPIINRGTYTRFSAIQKLVTSFLRSSPNPALDRQIICLGAGFDTRFFMLKVENIQPKLHIDIDFPEVTSRKAQIIKKNKEMAGLLGNHVLAAGGSEIHGDEYCLLSGDLTQWNSEIVPKLMNVGFDPSVPTLILAELVYVYMPPEFVQDILVWSVSAVTSSVMINYDLINPHDSFGKMMMDNLKMRKIMLPGLLAYPSLECQKKRFFDSGYVLNATAVTMLDQYEIHTPLEERHRVSKVEMFDEVEEWQLMASHYCIAWACQSRDSLPQDWMSKLSL